ncbi:MAG: gliding motility-associated C-terminal domain-containing protein [Spirochaetes bacterium]|nr:gliding motility-associated C-terminal domain-containing protein [Spirochaetota bacterium]
MKNKLLQYLLLVILVLVPWLVKGQTNVIIPVSCTITIPTNIPPLTEANITIIDYDPKILYTKGTKIILRVEYTSGALGKFAIQDLKENLYHDLIETTNGLYYGEYRVGEGDVKRNTFPIIKMEDIYSNQTIYTSTKTLDIDQVVYQDEGTERIIISQDTSKTRIYISKGSLTDDAVIVIKKTNLLENCIAYNFNMVSAKNGQMIKYFKNNNRLEISFNLSDNNIIEKIGKDLDQARIMIYYHDGAQWMPTGGSLDKVRQIMLTYVNHFSMYAIRQIDGIEYRMGPNPFTPNSDGINDQVVFSITDIEEKPFSISIFKLNGSHVITLDKAEIKSPGILEIYWDGRDEGNTLCEDGIYIYHLVQGDKHYKGLIILAR